MNQIEWMLPIVSTVGMGHGLAAWVAIGHINMHNLGRTNV